MSYCKRDGDHTSVFVAQEDVGNPDVVNSMVEGEEEFGVILPNGEINWDCPCLGGMPSGPCGQEFKDAFSCFHYSTAEEKGSDCIESFKAMQVCFQQYPELYADYNESDVAEEKEGKEEGEGRDKRETVIISEQTKTSADSGSKRLTSSSAS